jgi:hypothetical protein
MANSVREVLDNIRPSFEYNTMFVDQYLEGKGLDMGCGNCPLLRPDCIHVDAHPQPLAVEQVGKERVIMADAASFKSDALWDFIFSSHMVEDLGSKELVIQCLTHWATMIRPGGHIVLLLPDMQGGRYPTVAEGGNPSHKIDVGVPFIKDIEPSLEGLELVQVDTIPHERSCTFDVVFRKREIADE